MGEGALLADADRGPLLLAVETATRVMSVAVMRGDRVLAEVWSDDPRPHSERLLPGIDEVLGQAGTGFAEIEAIAVSIGPGSFTGLRVGLATVKGLAFQEGPQVVAVPTLAGLAAAALPPGGPVAALLDARRGEVYAGGWEDPTLPSPDRPEHALLPESVYTPGDLAATLVGTGLPWRLVAGEDALAAAQLVAEQAAVQLSGSHEVPARASRVGRVGVRLLAAGKGCGASDLVPRYVRRAEAEVRRTGAKVEAEPTA